MAAYKRRPDRRQGLAIACLLRCATVRAAADESGVGERTLLRWLGEDTAFQAAYRAARRQVVTQAIGQLQRATGEAVTCLRAVMQDTASPASARVSAAKAVLDAAIRGVEIEDFDARLTEIEHHLGLDTSQEGNTHDRR